MFNKSNALFLGLLLTLTACALNSSRADLSAVQLPDSFLTEPGLSGETEMSGIYSDLSEEAGEWWRGFKDPALNALMETAFENSLDIAIVYERLNRARALKSIETGATGVGLELGANGGRRKAATGTADTYALSAAASYEIDLWGRLGAKSEAARKEVAASKEDLKAIYISLSAEVAEQYYLAVERSLQLKVAALMIDVASERLLLSEQRYVEGLVPGSVLYTAREGLATAKSRRPSIEADLAGAGHTVSILVGSVPKAEVQGLNKYSNHLPDPPLVPVLLPSQLVARRPDLGAALLRVEASDFRVAAAIADRFPSFSLRGEYGGASSNLSSLLDSPNILWSLFLQATAPVIDSGRRRAEVKRTEALFNESLLQYRLSLLKALKEVEDAISRNRAAVVGIPLAVARREAAQGALDVALERYRNGVGDYMDVLTERQRLYEAQSVELGAERNLISARITLVRSLGGDFMERVISERGRADGGGVVRAYEPTQFEEIK